MMDRRFARVYIWRHEIGGRAWALTHRSRRLRGLNPQFVQLWWHMDRHEGKHIEPSVIKGRQAVQEIGWHVLQLRWADGLTPKDEVSIAETLTNLLNAINEQTCLTPTYSQGSLESRADDRKPLRDVNEWTRLESTK